VFKICILFAVLLVSASCATSHPDPLAGYHFADLKDFNANKAIKEDYDSYVQKLTSKTGGFVGSFDYLTDDKGLHAINIKLGVNGTWYEHILIYDQDNKRIKVIKFRNGGYRS
jgi:hypothetical protein